MLPSKQSSLILLLPLIHQLNSLVGVCAFSCITFRGYQDANRNLSLFLSLGLVVSDTFREGTFCLVAYLALKIRYPNDDVTSFGTKMCVFKS